LGSWLSRTLFNASRKTIRVPFNDLVGLERALHSRTIAAFIAEPIQGKGVNLPAND